MMIYLNQKFQSLRLVDALVGLNLCPLNGEFAPLLLKLHFYFEVFHLQIQLDQRLANYQLTHHIQIGKVDDFRSKQFLPYYFLIGVKRKLIVEHSVDVNRSEEHTSELQSR